MLDLIVLFILDLIIFFVVDILLTYTCSESAGLCGFFVNFVGVYFLSSIYWL